MRFKLLLTLLSSEERFSVTIATYSSQLIGEVQCHYYSQINSKVVCNGFHLYPILTKVGSYITHQIIQYRLLNDCPLQKRRKNQRSQGRTGARGRAKEGQGPGTGFIGKDRGLRQG